jgi:hypothetical protein
MAMKAKMIVNDSRFFDFCVEAIIADKAKTIKGRRNGIQSKNYWSPIWTEACFYCRNKRRSRKLPFSWVGYS